MNECQSILDKIAATDDLQELCRLRQIIKSALLTNAEQLVCDSALHCKLQAVHIKPVCNDLCEHDFTTELPTWSKDYLPILETREFLELWLSLFFPNKQKRLDAVWHWNRMLTWLACQPQNYLFN